MHIYEIDDSDKCTDLYVSTQDDVLVINYICWVPTISAQISVQFVQGEKMPCVAKPSYILTINNKLTLVGYYVMLSLIIMCDA
jgi:hypothetical protein